MSSAHPLGCRNVLWWLVYAQAGMISGSVPGEKHLALQNSDGNIVIQPLLGTHLCAISLRPLHAYSVTYLSPESDFILKLQPMQHLQHPKEQNTSGQ